MSYDYECPDHGIVPFADIVIDGSLYRCPYCSRSLTMRRHENDPMQVEVTGREGGHIAELDRATATILRIVDADLQAQGCLGSHSEGETRRESQRVNHDAQRYALEVRSALGLSVPNSPKSNRQ